MLDHLRGVLEQRGIGDVTLTEADVLHLDALPTAWSAYDLIVSASMLEYVPRITLSMRCAGSVPGCKRMVGSCCSLRAAICSHASWSVAGGSPTSTPRPS
jgi:hypothetical protein